MKCIKEFILEKLIQNVIEGRLYFAATKFNYIFFFFLLKFLSHISFYHINICTKIDVQAKENYIQRAFQRRLSLTSIPELWPETLKIKFSMLDDKNSSRHCKET